MSGNPAAGAVVGVDVDGGREQRESFVRLEREIGLLLRRSRAISARLARELHPDLDGAAYGLLALLADTGPLRASDLVARLGLDKSTVSRQLSSLVALGMVDREPDPADGRAQVLRPSPDGAARLTGIRDARRARWEADLSGWPADDVATLAELLARLNRIGEAREAQDPGTQDTGPQDRGAQDSGAQDTGSSRSRSPVA